MTSRLPHEPRLDAPGDAGGVLVVGYGNPLRRDDGVGPAVAARVAADPRLAGASVLARHQLVPELAVDLAAARLAVFVDASVDLEPGAVVVREAALLGAEPSGAAGPSSHHVGIEELLLLARELYGAAPRAFVVSIGVADLATGEGLTPEVAAGVGEAVEAVLQLITGGAAAS